DLAYWSSSFRRFGLSDAGSTLGVRMGSRCAAFEGESSSHLTTSAASTVTTSAVVEKLTLRLQRLSSSASTSKNTRCPLGILFCVACLREELRLSAWGEGCRALGF